MLRKLRRKQAGFIVTLELLLISTVLIIALIVGWVAVRDGILMELGDLSEAIGALNQSYSVSGAQNASQTAQTLGSAFSDAIDTFADTGLGNASSEFTFALNVATPSEDDVITITP